MKVGDLIAGDPDRVLMLTGYTSGVIIGERVLDPDDPFQTKYQVLWENGEITHPSLDYLYGFEVVS